MLDFFNYGRSQEGLELLEKAASSDHIGACYIFGIILLFSGEGSKEKGMEMLHRIKRSLEPGSLHRRLRNYRKNLCSWGILWKNEHIFSRLPICCAMKNKHTKAPAGWEPESDSEDEACHQCLCDREAAYFCETFYKGKAEQWGPGG